MGLSLTSSMLRTDWVISVGELARKRARLRQMLPCMVLLNFWFTLWPKRRSRVGSSSKMASSSSVVFKTASILTAVVQELVNVIVWEGLLLLREVVETIKMT